MLAFIVITDMCPVQGNAFLHISQLGGSWAQSPGSAIVRRLRSSWGLRDLFKFERFWSLGGVENLNLMILANKGPEVDWYPYQGVFLPHGQYSWDPQPLNPKTQFSGLMFLWLFFLVFKYYIRHVI